MVKNPKTARLWLLPVGTGLLAQLLFFLQGGFGAGHGPFDLIIFLMMLPSILLLPLLPSISLLERNDLLMIIWLPLLINVLFFRLVQFVRDHANRKL